MRHFLRISGALAIAAGMLFTGLARGADSDAKGADDEAMKIATQVTTEGAATFDTFNAAAMAAYYREDAELVMVMKEQAGGLKIETRKGRAEIEKTYAELFKKPETVKSKNTVEYARLIGSDILVIAGTFDTNTLKPDSLKVPFYQVRFKEDDKWMISSLKFFVILPK